MRVLILYLSIGSGHKVAAKSLEEAIKSKYPEVEVKKSDLIGTTGPSALRLLPEAVIGLAPNFYDAMWDNKFLKKGYDLVDNPLLEIMAPKIERLINKFQPNIVVSTHAIQANIYSHIRAEKGFNIPGVNVITDFGLHPYWFTKGVNKYIVPHQSVKELLIKQGVDKNFIFTTGIPISPKFSDLREAEETPKELGINDGIPNILFIFGAKMLGPYRHVMKISKKLITDTYEKLQNKYTITAAVGSNKVLMKRLKSLKLPINVIGYTNNMPQLLMRSTLLVAKPGGLITSEALAVGLPIIIIGKPAGQERENANFLIREGAGIKLVSDIGVAQLLETLLSDKTRLNSMRRRARKLGKPKSALDAADIIISTAKSG